MFYQKLSDNVYSGEAPSGDDFQFLQSLGIQNVLNLEMGILDFLWRPARNYELLTEMDLGMKCTHLMMSAILAPTFRELDHALTFIKTYPGPVFFHCKRGKDRTGMVRAAYRVLVQGWTVDDAINEMVALGHAVFPYFWWRAHLRAYIKARQA